MSSPIRFFRYNKQKKLTLMTYLYSAFYRMTILFLPAKIQQRFWGNSGEESKDTESVENYRYARQVARQVNRIADKTLWESKCLVRALTARRLLLKKGISCTLYLGVGKDENDKMIAHAWLRAGEFYVTGGNGTGYAMVAKFSS